MAFRTCSRQISLLQINKISYVQRCNINSEIPSFIAPIFNYATDHVITHGIQTGIEVIQASGLEPTTSFVVMGLTLRVLTAPIHFYAEKIFAKRYHVTNFLAQNILKKIGDHYKLKMIPKEDRKGITLDTQDQLILRKAEEMIKKEVTTYAITHNLQIGRIMCIKMSTIPIWFFSSFSIRNIINDTGFQQIMYGYGWIKNFAVPDPYYIIPVCVGIFGLLNFYSQPNVYGNGKGAKIYEAGIIFMSLVAIKIMTILPACIPLYWLVVSATGLAQTMIIRNSKVKKLCGINRLPTDSDNPLRNLFRLRKNRQLTVL